MKFLKQKTLRELSSVKIDDSFTLKTERSQSSECLQMCQLKM